MDRLQGLEGATYAAFIVGAIVAVYELRDIKKESELPIVDPSKVTKDNSGGEK